MKGYERIISAIREESPLFKMIQMGVKPKEIKEAVVESLEPYFDNRDILEQLAIKVLVPESINLLKIKKDKWLFEMFEKCLFTYRLAKTKDQQSCFRACALWQPYITRSISIYWSVLHLEVPKSDLGIEEFLHECLRNIGDIIESVTKPYLKVLLHQTKIANGIKIALEDIDSLGLGTIVSELISKSGYGDLFMPPPQHIRLNQWRNIAYHNTAKIENGEIICWYGKTPNITKIRLSRNELLQVGQTVMNTYKVLRLAYTLFCIDNLNEIDEYSPAGEVRDEAVFVNFATALGSQGFEIVDYNKNPECAKLVVKDISDLNPDERRFHASQFLLPLWVFTHSKRVIVEYRESDNTPNFLVSASSDTCEKVYNGELELPSLAETMDMSDLKTKKTF